MIHKHKHIEIPSAQNTILMAFLLNFVFAVIELIGGLLTNSVSILSDAIHDFGDSAALGFTYYLQKLSLKKADKRYTYGYKRYSLIGSLFISVILIVSSVFIVSEGIRRIFNPQTVNAGGMILLAIMGIFVNGLAVLKLKNGKSLNEKAVYIHLMEDVLGWIAVLIAAIVLYFVNFPIIDPLLSIIITIWVIYNVFKNIKEAISILMQQSPSAINYDLLKSKIKELDNVADIHDFHLWSLDGENHILTLHVVTQNNDYNSSYISKLKTQIKSCCLEFGVGHVTIEIETMSEEVDCKHCD